MIQEARLCAGYLGTLIPVAAYVAWRAGLRRFLYCTFTFATHYYSSFARNNLGVYMVDVPVYSGWQKAPAVAIWLFVHLLIPLIYLLFLAGYRRESSHRPEAPWDRLMLVNLVGLVFFLSILSAPNWLKIASASLPGLILLAWFLKSDTRLHKSLRGLLWCLGLIVAVATPLETQLDWHGILNSPTGRAAVLDEGRDEKYQWLMRGTRPGEFVFEAGDTDIYFLLGLRNPTPLVFLTPTDYTRPEQADNALRSLERHGVRFVLWPAWLDLPEKGREAGDHLGALRAYLRNSYHVVKTFGDGEQVWERK